MHNPFFDALVQNATEQPQRPCFQMYGLSGHEKTVSSSRMLDGIRSAGALFRENGVAPGDIVLIFAAHSEGMFQAFFGAQWIGAIPTFMPPPTVKQKVTSWASSHRLLIERIRPRLVVSEPECLGHVEALGVERVLSTLDLEASPPADLPLVSRGLDDIAFLQHSSGTTGLKKGVTVTYRQLLSQIDTYAASISFSRDSSVVSWLPIYHDMGLIAATLMPFRFGVPVALIDTFAWLANPGSLLSLAAERANVFCWLPNFAFNYLAKRSRADLAEDALKHVRAFINCSEPCKAQDMRAFEERFQRHGLPASATQVCYAAAEYVFGISQTQFPSGVEALDVDAEKLEIEGIAIPANGNVRSRSIVSVGQPIPGVDIRIGASLPEGHVGEVNIRGPALCSGYFRNEETTNEKFVDGWYRSGDLGFLANGHLYITGRMDDLIIVRGKNIYAHDIEEVASRSNGVKDGRTIAFGIEDGSGTQQLVLAIETSGEIESRPLKAEINDRINASFGIVPYDIVAVQPNSLVKTTSGKISRSENRRRYIDKGFDVAP